MIHNPACLENVEALRENLTIVTSTFYRNDDTSRVRQALALRLLENTEALGIRCVVVDGGSNEEFLEQLSRFSNVTIVEENPGTMGSGRREAIQAAIDTVPTDSNDPCFLWVEPEKYRLITEDNLFTMMQVLTKVEADIIVPQRPADIEMPELQKKIERRANREASGIVGGLTENKVFDLWFGPKMFNMAGAQSFLRYGDGKLDKWDSIIGPVIDAIRNDLRVLTVPVDFAYDPSEISHEDESLSLQHRRVYQYVHILRTLRGALGGVFAREGAHAKIDSNRAVRDLAREETT